MASADLLDIGLNKGHAKRLLRKINEQENSVGVKFRKVSDIV
jgi:hypothetical protein